MEKTEKAEGYFGFIVKDLFSSKQTDSLYRFLWLAINTMAFQ